MDPRTQNWLTANLSAISGQNPYPEGLPGDEPFPHRALDGSERSFKAIDAWLGKVKPGVATCSPAHLLNLTCGIGVYLGEVLRQRGQQRQIWLGHDDLITRFPYLAKQSDDTVAWQAVLVMETGRLTFPFHLAEMAITGGPAYGLMDAVGEVREGSAFRELRGQPAWRAPNPDNSRYAARVRELYQTLPLVIIDFPMEGDPVHLDFSFDSLDRIDSLVKPIIAGGLLPFEPMTMERFILSMTAYLGEVIRRRSPRDLRWMDYDQMFAGLPRPPHRFSIGTTFGLVAPEGGGFILPGLKVLDRFYSNLIEPLGHAARWECRTEDLFAALAAG